jgi:parallel beta-helix repeat protein
MVAMLRRGCAHPTPLAACRARASRRSANARCAAILSLLAVTAMPGSAQQGRAAAVVELQPGMVITVSTRLAARTYRLRPPASLDSALIIVRGDDITLDLGGAVIQGGDPLGDPDLAAGVAIRIEGGRNVRVRNGTIRGFRIAVLARDTRGLELRDIDASYNWKPRLFSLVEHESLVDWLSFHRNEQDEWLRFGAAFYLSGVTSGTIRGNTAQQGMNGLLMTRTDSVVVEGNNFSFNSGLGIGLYRSSHNTIVHNRADYNVRGYSHGFYRRGQDSAGILLYEQSMHNVVAFNSATHGGDGLFLWAGQSTMDTGAGGANDNLFYGNDFSFAPANAMEATFSRNGFVANRAEGSEYGLWAGYSYESKIVANCFAGNRFGIAIEHGQDNVIAGNRFVGDSVAVRLWADSIASSEWGYPKRRDTRSRDYRIEANTFAGVPERIRAANTTGLQETGSDTVPGSAGCTTRPRVPREFAALAPGPKIVRRPPPPSEAARRDRSAIVVDEWGPFDWKSPKLWPVDSTRKVPLRLAVLGPSGRWRVADRRGIEAVSRETGRVGDTIAVIPFADSTGDWELTLEYRGAATTSARGVRRAAGEPLRFSYARFEPRADWDVRFFTWNDSSDPRTREGDFAALLRGTPVLTRRLPRLDFMWYRPLLTELPVSRWALEASARVALPPGSYSLRTISDDGIRVWVDGRLVIDRWTLHGSEIDYAAITGGPHAIRVQFFQVDGWTELRLEFVRGAVRSAGSPGPR